MTRVRRQMADFTWPIESLVRQLHNRPAVPRFRNLPIRNILKGGAVRRAPDSEHPIP